MGQDACQKGQNDTNYHCHIHILCETVAVMGYLATRSILRPRWIYLNVLCTSEWASGWGCQIKIKIQTKKCETATFWSFLE